MMTKKALTVFFISTAVILALSGVTGRAIHAQNAGDTDAAVANKLELVLNNQKLILGELAAIKEELAIIKVRVTQAQ